jgi:SulP family sulfate permease
MKAMDLTYFPFIKEIGTYTREGFFKDFIAAISVALLALPQSMAYAFVAGMPPQVGIFSAIFGTLFASAFGQSRYLIAGPTTQSAILIQSGLSEILTNFYPNLEGVARADMAVDLLIQLVFLVGFLQLMAGLLKMGRITQFTSRSVIAGYSVGVALAIIVTQLYPFLGIAPPTGYTPLYLKTWYLIKNISLTHLPTFLLALSCLGLFILTEKLPKQIPIPLFIFVLSGALVYYLKLSPTEGLSITDVEFGEIVSKITLIGDIGPVVVELPQFQFPSIDLAVLGQLLPFAFAIAFLSVIQAATIGRTYASLKDPPYNDSQEIYGLGVSNLACSFFGGMPSGGNLYRTALNHASGATSRYAGMLSGLILFLAVFFFGPFATKIPLAALSALMLLIAFQMLDVPDLGLCLKSTRADAFIVILTFMSCLFISFDLALYVGIGVSVLLYLKQAAEPSVVEYAFNNVGKLRALDPHDDRPDNRIAIFQPEGELFFGAAEFLQTQLRLASEDENIKIIILQMLNARYIDASICLVIKYLNKYFQKTGRLLMLSGVSADVYKILDDAGIINKLGRSCVFKVNEKLPGEATRLAYARAKVLLSEI